MDIKNMNEIIFYILCGLFTICYLGALYQHGKEMSELPEKVDKILREIYKIK